MTQPPPDQQPTQHAPSGPPPGRPHPQQQPPPQQQWPVAPPPGPYGGGSPGAPYQQPFQQPYQQPYQQPPSSSGTGKAIAIIVGAIILVVVLFCGGIAALVWWIADSVEDGINEYDADRLGGRSNPISVAAGDEFEIDGVEYAAGWRIQPPTDEYSGDSIMGLEATNDRDDESSEYVYLSFTFVDAEDTEVGEITCSSDGSIAFGNSETLDCRGYDRIIAPYDHIEVSAS